MRRTLQSLPIPTLLLAGLAVFLPAAPDLLAAGCDGVSPAPSTTLTSVRVHLGRCSNDAARVCRMNTDCVSPGTCATTHLTKPLYVTAPPADTTRIFVLEQDGRVRIIRDGQLVATPFLDVDGITQSAGNEEGLLGLAFSPTYATDGYFFIYHTDNGGNSNTIARYQVSGDPDVADPATRTVVLAIPHPTNTNHNGGIIHFAPDDGYLYIGVGDGGSSCDPMNNAQNTNELKGKILRLDVIPAPVPPDPPYRIPPSNQGLFPRPEILSIGVRNPWRLSFDRGNPHVAAPAPGTGDLYIADVGQNNWEEINYRTAASKGLGENYGWDHYEGFACPPPFCGGACGAISPRVNPVKAYAHSGGACSVTGGYVYRGCRMPALAGEGRYFYADYCSAAISSFVISDGEVTSEKTHTSELVPVGGFLISQITSFGEDARGEIYIVDRGSTNSGEIFKVVPTLNALEVSGPRAQGMMLGADWTWEDLTLTSGHPIDSYKVYRHMGTGSGTFFCVYRTPAFVPPSRAPAIWLGGDPQNPMPGEVFSYIVTAVRNAPTPTESSPGRSSSGVPRDLNLTACPP